MTPVTTITGAVAWRAGHVDSTGMLIPVEVLQKMVDDLEGKALPLTVNFDVAKPPIGRATVRMDGETLLVDADIFNPEPIVLSVPIQDNIRPSFISVKEEHLPDQIVVLKEGRLLQLSVCLAPNFPMALPEAQKPVSSLYDKPWPKE